MNPSNSNDLVVDALEGSGISNYDRLMTEFGIEHFSNIIERIPIEKRHNFITRGIMFGHTDMLPVLDAIENRKLFGCMTGIKPTGSYHIGSLSTVQEVIYFQQLGAKVYFCVADIEAYAANDQSLEISEETAIDNIADVLALGLDPDPDKAYIYKQSTEPEVLKMGFVFSSTITSSTLRSIYGDKKNIGYYNSAFIQSADILLPQLLESPMPTVTPIGADQAPHSRLTRDIARKERFQKQYKFKLPSFTFHYLLEGIDGSEKMSKKIPMSVFSLTEDFKTEIKPKIQNALTGGKDTAAEQRKLGGEPDKCRVFDLFKFMFEPDDKALLERKTVCKNGTLLCGPCKRELMVAIENYQEHHLNKKDIQLKIAKEIIKDLSNRN
jgi:tryptophanyl-tRNA synthetase